jgi:hypothetical protein
LQAADYLADEASTSSLCTELGHRIFDAFSATEVSKPMDSVAPSTTTTCQEEATEGRHTAAESIDVGSSSMSGVTAELQTTNTTPTLGSTAMAENCDDGSIEPMQITDGEQVSSRS